MTLDTTFHLDLEIQNTLSVSTEDIHKLNDMYDRKAPSPIDTLRHNFMRAIVVEAIACAQEQKPISRFTLHHNIKLVMAAAEYWRPAAQSIDFSSGTQLVVIFDREAHAKSGLHPELWALMSLDENPKIYKTGLSPKDVLDFLIDNNGNHNLPFMDTYRDEVTPLRAFRRDVLVPPTPVK